MRGWRDFEHTKSKRHSVSKTDGAGRIALGMAYDRFKGKAALFINSGLSLCAALLLCFEGISGQAVFGVLGLALAGSGYGGDPTISSALVRDIRGEEHYSVDFAIVNLTMIPSSQIGPMISSRIIVFI